LTPQTKHRRISQRLSHFDGGEERSNVYPAAEKGLTQTIKANCNGTITDVLTVAPKPPLKGDGGWGARIGRTDGIAVQLR
jgi:hypothetical protein